MRRAKLWIAAALLIGAGCTGEGVLLNLFGTGTGGGTGDGTGGRPGGGGQQTVDEVADDDSLGGTGRPLPEAGLMSALARNETDLPVLVTLEFIYNDVVVHVARRRVTPGSTTALVGPEIAEIIIAEGKNFNGKTYPSQTFRFGVDVFEDVPALYVLRDEPPDNVNDNTGPRPIPNDNDNVPENVNQNVNENENENENENINENINENENVNDNIPQGGGGGPSPITDCNQNGIDDATDIAGGTSNDCNDNGTPDECDIQIGHGDTVRGFGDATSLLFPLDGSYTLAMAPNDDGSSAEIPLGFAFDFYGTLQTSVFINNNGNISFGEAFGEYTAEGFPVDGFPMIAPFWADVDTRHPAPRGELGSVWYKVEDNTLIVTWANVGYYSFHGEKRNTFQLAISDGANPVIGIGNNVAFSYDEMEWTTGDASAGTNGFLGVPSTVGANRGDGTDFFLIGRFDHEGADYDGPGGAADGVSYLDGRVFQFSTSTAGDNIDPIATGFPPGNAVTLFPTAGDELDLTLQFLSPEAKQTTSVNVIDVDNATGNGLAVTNTPGNIAVVRLSWTPGCGDEGTYTLRFVASDDFVPPGVTTVSLTVRIVCGSEDCNENGIPDECELVANDCNENGVPDECDVAGGTSQDCNSGGLPDECEEDCDENGTPDDCEETNDCNENGTNDACDISSGSSDDCDQDGVPDECEETTDCNENGINDACDVAFGTSTDCDSDGLSDDCEGGDCNENGVFDGCDILFGNSADCQPNGVPDECDISSGSSGDCDTNGVPNECEVIAGITCAANPEACEDSLFCNGIETCRADGLCIRGCSPCISPDFCNEAKDFCTD